MRGINHKNKKKKTTKSTKEKSADEGYKRILETRGKHLTYSRALSSIVYCHNLSLLYMYNSIYVNIYAESASPYIARFDRLVRVEEGYNQISANS